MKKCKILYFYSNDLVGVKSRNCPNHSTPLNNIYNFLIIIIVKFSKRVTKKCNKKPLISVFKTEPNNNPARLIITRNYVYNSINIIMLYKKLQLHKYLVYIKIETEILWLCSQYQFYFR